MRMTFDTSWQLRAWTQKNNLKWEAIGLDLEIDFKEVTLLATGHIATFIADVANRLEHPQLLEDAKATVREQDIIHASI